MTRPIRPGYREHDHVTEWQECDTCELRLGAGISTPYDLVYYADNHDPEICPRCEHGRMGFPEHENTDG